ncbi:hypothetical protein ACPCK9_26505 [Streptomyces koyangensis]|uniref:hypothetical protein n=1 Tax=Streptomyces koyangensis TaxID=188770 RepID=UPI003C2DAB57
MPLNIPVITRSPTSRRYTVHTDRQRWSAEQLAAVGHGRTVMEWAVRRGVREAALSCLNANFTPADIIVDEHPDGSVAMTGRVLCDGSDCHTAAQRRHYDAVEAFEAKTATEWAAKELNLAPGKVRVVQERVLPGRDRHRLRVPLGFVLAGAFCATAGGLMGRYDYAKPEGTSPGSDIEVWVGQNANSLFTQLANPSIVAGLLLVLYGIVRLLITKTTK